ncbi:hypothetical protein [Luteipulveratus mongoliensis]|uniref:Uncharacterized protein n=1 Tax=Luteipulveratus mongoliensis TaxID=571913 RepID=A0A0K1JI47_9MICO|nr:hypothetical protein [Luteipulveratus mongoliensis]AKU16253.1 hypothetical protein VV02_10900 [Luteipulveratus mongoliensis]
MAAQAAALVVLVVIALAQVITGHADGVTQALTEAALVLVFAACAAALAWALLHGKAVARTPTLVWNALLLPVGASMVSGGATVVGVVVLVCAIATLLAALLVPRADLD